MEIETILLIVLWAVEIAFILTVGIVYVCRAVRRARFEKQNHKLALEGILKETQEVCKDNIRLLGDNTKLTLENAILKQENKELKEENDTFRKVNDSDGNKRKKSVANSKSNKSESDKKVATKKSPAGKKRTTNTLAN